MSMSIPKEILESAVRLHGHLGPFLILGLKMGIGAERILGEKPEQCKVETRNVKPFLCALDGIKAIMEGDAVTVREGDGLTGRFSKANGKEVIFKVKRTVIDKYRRVPWEKCEQCAYEIMQCDDQNLFEYTMSVQ
jgi:formylmethanofuran dehydrogenase subunit E